MLKNATAARPGAAAAAVVRAQDQSQYTPTHQPTYSPHQPGEHRRCATCGRADRWKRRASGGWACCWAAPDLEPRSRTMRHRCSALCAGGAA